MMNFNHLERLKAAEAVCQYVADLRMQPDEEILESLLAVWRATRRD